MKKRVVMAILLVILLVMMSNTIVAAGTADGPSRARGLGSFIDQYDNKVTFGFCAQTTGKDAEGNFWLIDCSKRYCIRGTFTQTWESGPKYMALKGTGTVRGKGTCHFKLWVYDNGCPGKGVDKVKILIYSDSETLYEYWQKPLHTGNVCIH